MSKIIGWAVLNTQGQIDSYYDTRERADARARALSETAGETTVAELHAIKKIRAIRSAWTYTEEPVS